MISDDAHWPIRVFGGEHNRHVCHYCGLPAETLDHIPPRASYSTDVERFRVPACQECNLLAGPTFHARFEDRAQYVKARLIKRHASTLATAEWSADELASMGRALRASIQKAIRLKRIVQARISFRIVGAGNA